MAMRATLLLFSVNQIRLSLAAMPYGLLLFVGVMKSRCVCVLGSNAPTADARCSVYQILPLAKVRSQGPLPGVTGHCPTKLWVPGSNSPIMSLFGVVNHTWPTLSRATKIGWLPVMFGSVKYCGVLDPAGSSPSCPGGVLDMHVG